MPDRDFSADFPLLQKACGGRRLAYLDNAATTQKPRAVIDRLRRFLTGENANIHRGVHSLSMAATASFDRARAKVASFLGAASPAEIVFTRGTTESINLVAHSFARTVLEPGDQVLVTEMEHHANIVPWQLVAAEAGAEVIAAPVTRSGEIDLGAFADRLSPRVKIAAFTHTSNVLGTVAPVRELVGLARAAGAATVVDGAQAVAHGPVDVTAIGCDFYAFSGHKVYGPDGIGALYGRHERLAAMPPYQGGGDMIERVSLDGTTFRQPPERFEAGTPNISGAVGLAAALDYLAEVGWGDVRAREAALADAAADALSAVPDLTIIGMPAARAPVFSFTLGDIHPHDIGTVLDSTGVAVRTGHHCAQPLMARLGLVATTRASFSFYNCERDIDQLIAGLHRARSLLS